MKSLTRIVIALLAWLALLFSSGHASAQAAGTKLPYVPVVTPNGSTLPYVLKDGVKEFRLVAEPVKREFAKGMIVDAWGYNGQVAGSVAGLPTFDALGPDLVPAGSPARAWAEERLAGLRGTVAAVHARGLRCLASTDLFVLPKPLVAAYREEICDAQGRIDIARPRMQEIFRLLLRETLDKAPELDGLIIRTGEVYLHNYPHHAASGRADEEQRQGGSAILDGAASHIAILNILRDEVCVKRGKLLIYRTWSFGPQSLHESTNVYLAVAGAVAPHSNLLFSIKHQQGDFHRLRRFNPTIGLGPHRQVVEVQAQLEAYGKGAHPYYVGQGVIEGWEEYAWMMPAGAPRGLRDVVHDARFAGVWTWSRGGGWEGPEIRNGLWCELNAYVVSQFVRDPARGEAALFNDFARGHLGLNEADAARFRQLNLLSAQAVLRGQLTTLGASVNEWWARDHFLEEPDLSDFVRRGLVEKALAEKAEAVALWGEIERLAQEIHFADAATAEFVRTSAAYGRIKYALIEQAWRIVFAGKAGDASGHYDRARLRDAIDRYDALWAEWRELARTSPSCATIYKDVGFEGRPGIGAAVQRYRTLPGGSP